MIAKQDLIISAKCQDSDALSIEPPLSRKALENE